MANSDVGSRLSYFEFRMRESRGNSQGNRTAGHDLAWKVLTEKSFYLNDNVTVDIRCDFLGSALKGFFTSKVCIPLLKNVGSKQCAIRMNSGISNKHKQQE